MDVAPYWRNFVGGAWLDGGAGRLTVEGPATGAPLAEQALADAADVDRAVAAARRCHESGALGGLRPCDRGRMVRQMGDWLRGHADEIAPVLTLESGKPLWEARIEIEGAARYFEYYGGQAETLEGRSIPLGAGYLDFTVHEPYGVSAQIIPWNYPLEMTARSLSAALAAGNACVVKTPELDPLTGAYFAKAAAAAGLPEGAVNILCGLGLEAGAALAAHPGVDQIVFTGSVETGVNIAKAAAENVVPCVLELGGKSAAIVFPDADLDAVMDSVRWGIFFNAGQVCSAMSRAIVHGAIHDEFVERAAALAQSLSVGPGIERPEFGANMGAMISEKQRDRAEGLCARAGADGARAVAGGRKLNRPGWFLEPSVFDGVDPASELGQTEVFGPVLSVMKFSTDDEAVAIANGTQYGLVGGVFTADMDRAMRTAQRLQAGQVFVNEWYAGGVETPFGGYGKSGYGREKGREALYNYVQTKNVAIRLGG
ncbi:MAG: aldehyde dehydrogenase family protein [Alphaproteobacteria bacterium]|nr:aldehyde dehydrogenase family protein [Alphaproteobacteria bacterium]